MEHMEYTQLLHLLPVPLPKYNLSLLCDQNIYALSISPICDICPIHFILLDVLNSKMQGIKGI